MRSHTHRRRQCAACALSQVRSQLDRPVSCRLRWLWHPGPAETACKRDRKTARGQSQNPEKQRPRGLYERTVATATSPDRIACRMSHRLYYADPSISVFDAHVSDIREVSRTQGQSLWQVSLDRSAFYPTSGGQPYDTGMLTATSSGGAVLEAPVLTVEEDERGEVWHTTPKPLLAGTAVRGYIDWSRRLDHMQQHSGQHLLSAVVYRQLGATTLSFHLGEMTSTIDLAREAISSDELERVEDAVNEIIAENRAVTMRNISPGEATMLLAAGTLHKLPDREGDIRLIEIDEIDLNSS